MARDGRESARKWLDWRCTQIVAAGVVLVGCMRQSVGSLICRRVCASKLTAGRWRGRRVADDGREHGMSRHSGNLMHCSASESTLVAAVPSSIKNTSTALSRP